MPLLGGLGDENFPDQPARRGGLDQVRAFGEKSLARRRPTWRCNLTAADTLAERSVSTETAGRARTQAASPEGALTSSGSAARATSTSAVNAAGSVIAISARFLRSTSTPAALRPWISRL